MIIAERIPLKVCWLFQDKDYHHNRDQLPEELETIAKDQDQIGWLNFDDSFISTELCSLMDHHIH